MSIDRWTDKEAALHIYTMEYYSAMKRNTFESVLIRWMNLEPITQKDKYHIVMHIIWNLGRQHWWTYLQGSRGDADTENRLTDTGGGRKERVGWMERVMWDHIHYHQWNTVNGNLLCDSGNPNGGLCDTLRGWDGVEGRFKREGTYIYPYGWFMLMYGRSNTVL